LISLAFLKTFNGLDWLHSHTYYANTDLFNFFTANFTAESP
jgi:hypothetical protein